MEFGNNILKNESAYYELKNASISNGILTIRPGGSAKCTIDSDYIVRATEYFLVNMIVDPFTDNYNPKAQARIHFVSSDEQSCYNYSLFPVENNTGVYSQQIKLKAGEYKEFTFEITSKEQIRFLVWELCPEAADEDIKTVIEGVEQSLPKLLYDYNTWPLYVEQDERTIALITFRLLDHTDLQGHFQLTYVASEATTLTLRFKDNEATELFSPLLYDLHAGRGSVGVPHAYLERLAGIHSLIVTAQVSSGTLAIETRGVLFTIDGGYLAERMLDVGADMQDISIRQLSEDNGPDEIWIVDIEKDEGLVRKRKYDPKATIGFEPVLSLGYAREAAIEFDGKWVLRANSENYTLETGENPWVFWIDKDYYLQAQIGDDESTKVTLERFATCIHTCRGYKSELYPEQDQGIILVFIKNAQAYYVQYQYNKTTQTYRWGDVTELDSSLTDVSYITVNRLNDYRVQITVKHATGVKTYISDRTYVNQAFLPETMFISGYRYMPMAYYPADYDITPRVIEQSYTNKSSFTDDTVFSDDVACVLRFVIDKELYLEYCEITDAISFNNSIPDYDEETGKAYVNSITYKVNEQKHTTEFTISLNLLPRKLITEVYINKVTNYGVQEKVSGYGYIIMPTTTVTFDTTHYIGTPMQKETFNIKMPKSTTIVVTPVNKQKEEIEETFTIKIPKVTNLNWQKIKPIKSAFNETMSIKGPVNVSITYTATTDYPI